MCRRLRLVVLPLLLGAFVPVQAWPQSRAPGSTKAAAQQERAALRAQFLRTAEAFATHEWRATEANVFHGKDPDGIQVDTPDAGYVADGWHADGRVNVGIPYKWGGFNSILGFDQRIEAGYYAGHLHEPGALGSNHAAGVDCSGFVSRCWNLPTKQSTRSIGALSYELDSYADLLPGDILNAESVHVMLFKEFVDPEKTKLIVYESASPCVQETVCEVADLQRTGYGALRYKPLDDRWIHMDMGEPTFCIEDGNPDREWRPDPGSATDLMPSELEHPLEDAAVGEWARYQVRDGHAGDQVSYTTRTVVRSGAEKVLFQQVDEHGEQREYSDSTFDWLIPFHEMLMDAGDIPERPRDIELVDWTVEEGEYLLGDASFPGHKIVANLTAALAMHRQSFPMEIDLECYQCLDVPLRGIVAASYEFRVDYGGGHVMRLRRQFDLCQYRIVEE